MGINVSNYVVFYLSIGAQMALEFVNHDPNILSDYELLMVIQDTQCKADLVMKQFMYFVVNDTHPVAGILGKCLLDY